MSRIYDGIGGMSACPYQRFEKAHNLTGRGLLHYNSTPQPEGPTRTMNSLSAMSRLNFCTAMTPSSVTCRLVFFSGSPFFFSRY